MASVNRHWLAEQIEGRTAVLAELARFLNLPVLAMTEIMRGEREISADEAQAISDFFGGEGFLTRDLSDDQRRLLELAFELTDEEFHYLLESAAEPNVEQGPPLD